MNKSLAVFIFIRTLDGLYKNWRSVNRLELCQHYWRESTKTDLGLTKLRPHDVNNSPSASCRNIIVEEPGDKAFLPRNWLLSHNTEKYGPVPISFSIDFSRALFSKGIYTRRCL